MYFVKLGNQASNAIPVMSYWKKNDSKYSKCKYRGYAFILR